MLKRFFLNTLSSFLGAWIAIAIFAVVGTIVGIGLIARIGLSETAKESVKKGSILVIKLDGEIVENDQPVEFDYADILQGDISKKKTLSGITGAIEAAAENKNIDAIYLKCGVASAAPATYNAIRNSLLKFKESGKKIIAYGEMYSMGTYYVASVADNIYINPGGAIELQGLGGFTLFYKNLLDKLGIEFQVVKVGSYKSAVEPYINTSMSEPARAQLDTLYGNMWKIIREGIAQQRDISATEIDSLVSDDFIFLKKGEEAVRYRLADAAYYERSLDSLLAAHLGKDKEKLNFVDPSLIMAEEASVLSYNSKEQIAVVYAAGEILDGGGSSTINYQRYVPIITKLADDKNVKGMVLRVNSPGGSVFGSEQIGDALDYFQSKGKPLAVSMGDYAASGGYWISCCADRIFADPLTITGSIGIFGLIPNIEKLMHKIGLNAELVATNPNAKFPNFMKSLTPRQTEAMQAMVSEGYDEFVGRVSKGRNLPESTVRRIGEGRVWDAHMALKIGLVDELGGLKDAISWVGEKLGNENYSVSTYPRIESSVWDFLPDLMNIEAMGKMKVELGYDIPLPLWKTIYEKMYQYPVQARMPEFNIKF